jgi:hypothetical protein
VRARVRVSGEWWWLKRRRREEGRSANRENVGRFQLQLYTLSKVDTSLSFSFFFSTYLPGVLLYT